ncbi:UNVERIFIED_CONTAM: hypothetical protein ABIE34_000515 [Jeotgalibacillus campisalis]
MNKSLKGASGGRTIRVFGSDQCFPAAADPVPLEGTAI